MTVGANSYGTAADVAALTTVYTASGSYTTTTQPTLAQVESFVDQVSAIINTALAAAGFRIPVTQADAVLSIKSAVVQACADLCHASNTSGRFFSERALNAGVSVMSALRKEIRDWVTSNADGLEALGAARTTASVSNEIGFRSTDSAGNELAPIFQRGAFGNTFKDWDE